MADLSKVRDAQEWAIRWLSHPNRGFAERHIFNALQKQRKNLEVAKRGRGNIDIAEYAKAIEALESAADEAASRIRDRIIEWARNADSDDLFSMESYIKNLRYNKTIEKKKADEQRSNVV